MDIKINSIIMLEDNKGYMVISKVEYNNHIYLYIVDENDLTNIKICEQINDELIDVEDGELITKLLPLLYKEARNNYFDKNDIN